MRVLLKSGASQSGADFSEILETACRSAGVDFDAPVARSPRIARGPAARLHDLAERERERRMSTYFASIESYLEHQTEKKRPRAMRPADPQSVADELSIDAKMTVADLNRLRREFALANHPDRVIPDERDIATRRMMIANMLIDREMQHRHAHRPATS